jgi:hypothetical protein
MFPKGTEDQMLLYEIPAPVAGAYKLRAEGLYSADLKTTSGETSFTLTDDPAAPPATR